jgi:hypothetical protein
MAKIFVRERGNVDEGGGRPRFAVVGVHGTDMKFFKTHLRKGELEAIAQAVGAELVTLPRGRDEHTGEEGGGGKRRHGRGRHGMGGDAAPA